MARARATMGGGKRSVADRFQRDIIPFQDHAGAGIIARLAAGTEPEAACWLSTKQERTA